MEIKVKRMYLKSTYTIGVMYIDGVRFCDTLEDKVRDLTKEKKVYGETAIPEGRYHVVMTYSPKFRRQMPLLQDVPHFEGVRIHAGNTTKDTEGCILLGENKVKGGLINSRKYVEELIARLMGHPEGAYITVE